MYTRGDIDWDSMCLQRLRTLALDYEMQPHQAKYKSVAYNCHKFKDLLNLKVILKSKVKSNHFAQQK